MHIALVSTNTYQTPPPGYGGEVAIWDLCEALCKLGHTVDMYATPLSRQPPRGRLFYMRCSHGTSIPHFVECEREVWGRYKKEILSADVVHDFSHCKGVAEAMFHWTDRRNVVSTLIGSLYWHPIPPFNVVVWSEAHRQMALTGNTGYEGTRFPQLGGWSRPVKDCRVTLGGVDTELYRPRGDHEDYYLWFSRMHPCKGFDVAIALAKDMGFPLKIMGDRPEDAPTPDHQFYGRMVLDMIRGVPNIEFVPLPPGPERFKVKLETMQRAKAFLYPVEFHECFGLAVVEAMACGVPIITTIRGSMPELVENGVNGFICHDEAHMRKAVENVDCISREDCRRIAVEKFSREKMAERYLKLYEAVMAGEVWGL